MWKHGCWNSLGSIRSKLDGIEAGADMTDAENVGSSIHGVDNKATPVDADKVSLIDTEASNVLKTSTWTNIKAFLKTYFDTLYEAINTAILKSLGTAKGDVIGFTASGTPARVGIGTNDQVLTADSAEAAGIKWATVSSSSYTDRGDPTTYDFSIGDLTLDDQWHDLDLSAIVGTGVKLVHIKCSIIADSIAFIRFRKNGNSNIYSTFYLQTQVADVTNNASGFVLTDADGVIEYYGNAGTFSVTNIVILGYF